LTNLYTDVARGLHAPAVVDDSLAAVREDARARIGLVVLGGLHDEGLALSSSSRRTRPTPCFLQVKEARASVLVRG
jgi:hypothetical protein